jgi:beta-lactamase regulating signal transducer with metallopeptidase domain
MSAVTARLPARAGTIAVPRAVRARRGGNVGSLSRQRWRRAMGGVAAALLWTLVPVAVVAASPTSPPAAMVPLGLGLRDVEAMITVPAGAAPATGTDEDVTTTRRKVRRIVAALVAIAATAGVLTVLFAVHTSPRRRRRIAARRAARDARRLAAAAALAAFGSERPAQDAPAPAAPAEDPSRDA